MECRLFVEDLGGGGSGGRRILQRQSGGGGGGGYSRSIFTGDAGVLIPLSWPGGPTLVRWNTTFTFVQISVSKMGGK